MLGFSPLSTDPLSDLPEAVEGTPRTLGTITQPSLLGGTMQRYGGFAGRGAGGLSGTVNQATETDSAQAISKAKIKALGQIIETDTAQTLTRIRTRAVGQVAEADASQAIGRLKAKVIGQTAETDVAQILSGRKIKAVAQATETDTAMGAARVKRLAVNQIIEIDAAQSIFWAPKRRLIGAAPETDAAPSITAAIVVDVYVPLVDPDILSTIIVSRQNGTLVMMSTNATTVTERQAQAIQTLIIAASNDTRITSVQNLTIVTQRVLSNEVQR